MYSHLFFTVSFSNWKIKMNHLITDKEGYHSKLFVIYNHKTQLLLCYAVFYYTLKNHRVSFVPKFFISTRLYMSQGQTAAHWPHLTQGTFWIAWFRFHFSQVLKSDTYMYRFCSKNICGTFKLKLPWIFLVVWPIWWWATSNVAHFLKMVAPACLNFTYQ